MWHLLILLAVQTNRLFMVPLSHSRQISMTHGSLQSHPFKSLPDHSWLPLRLIPFCMHHDMCAEIAPCYAPDDTEIESLLGRDFLHPSGPALEHTQHPIHSVLGLCPGSKAAGTWREPPPPRTGVKEILKLYFNSPSGPTWPVPGFALTLPLCVSILGFIPFVSYRSLVRERCYIELKSSTRCFRWLAVFSNNEL
jgi:hypothetical protein